jgi:macrophage erythroblast attacher
MQSSIYPLGESELRVIHKFVAHLNLSILRSETQADEVQQAMATLLYSGRVHEAPSRMGELLNGGGREELASAFVSEARASFGLPSIPVLELALQCGLSALKTPLCYEFCEECDTGCPVCSECGRILAKGLPFSHHSHSTLICRLSGEVMDDSNPPLALPNGRVYSSNALRSMAEGGGGEVTCPVTKEKFPIESARSLYII